MRGEHGWATLFFYVIVWDRYGPETLTAAARRHRIATTLICGITTLHLLGYMPPRLDPYKLLRSRKP